MAVAASILTAVYAVLKNAVDYADLGAEHFSRADRIKTANRLLRKLGDLGVEVRDMRDRSGTGPSSRWADPGRSSSPAR